MFEIRWNVFVVRVRAGEFGIVRVRLRIVPVEFLRAAPDFVAVTDETQQASIQHQTLVVCSVKLRIRSRYCSRRCSQIS